MSETVSLAGYTFAANKASLACKHVIEGQRPVLGFVHEPDGEIQFLCGDRGHVDDDYAVVCLSHLVERHPDLRDLPKVEFGAEAWRERPGDDWVRSKL